MSPSTFFLLPAYISFETTRAILSFAAVRLHIEVSPTLIAFGSELLKLVVAIIFLRVDLVSNGGSGGINDLKSAILFATKDQASWRAYGLFTVPAVLYLINNILYLLGLQLTTPSLLHVAMLAKLPFTGVLHHFVVRRQKNMYAWISLACICFGLLLYNAPIEVFQWMEGSESTKDSAVEVSYLIGPMIGLVIAVVSAFASIFTEMAMKQDISFMVAQFWLYLYGTMFAGSILLFWNGRVTQSILSSRVESASVAWVVDVYAAVIVATAVTGLVVANILRKADNLVKLVGTSAAIVTIILAQIALFPELRLRTIQAHSTLGVGIITVATWTYNYYKSVPPNAGNSISDVAEKYYELSQEPEHDEGRLYVDSPTEVSASPFRNDTHHAGSDALSEKTLSAAQVEATMLTPDWKKVTAASVIVALLTVLTFSFAPPYVPSEPAISSAISGQTDVERFFRPHNITPAVWGKTPSPLTCIQDWIDREGVRPHSNKFVDWEYTFPESGCPVYPVPEGGLIFHVYWSGNWRPFNEVTIEAFLATQRLRDGHRLIYWYENGGPSEETRQRWTAGEYAKYVEFREFNRTEEASGTCLATMPEYADAEYQQSWNMPQATLSDLVRVLLLAKYGGIWMDADVIPMRDLTPMIRTGPTAPWLDGNDSNNALLNFGPVEAGIGAKVLDVACSMSYNGTLFHERYPSIQPLFWSCKCLLPPVLDCSWPHFYQRTSALIAIEELH